MKSVAPGLVGALPLGHFPIELSWAPLTPLWQGQEDCAPHHTQWPLFPPSIPPLHIS